MWRRNLAFYLTMTSQRILKLLALSSLIAAISAIVIWRQTGEPPSPWLIRVAIAALAAAFTLFVVNGETRPRIMLHFLAALFAVCGLFAFTADFSAAHASGHGFNAASVLDRLNDFAPSLLTSLRNAVTRTLGDAVWDPILTTVLSVPAYLMFAGLAAISGYAGRPRRHVQIFIN